ncbi:acyl-CoA dehydrogenase [Acinetobacter qingfengensis]|uniref:3-methylmercaptopropionyl-CoA dehydrogenase n=1 Tax=Acinetobacter qingfengensis TaxID=1262585 RepID=A0A1E7RGB1_9GAMM|nr:acyl-CoA dehydrogenase C-terminal domain-containing protein [Acinetobacter qingfengensis]KAA8732682.1 acyl-CoA dehydrogenase [Acinetobacter qingfengensis]OEY98205.1 acyl-CoA dehydrogenase [Acinetobacter qingfengensis]
MPVYKAPLRDIRFLMNEVFDFSSHYKTLSNSDLVDADTIDMILEGAADFCENTLSPLYQSGDSEGCHWNNGDVTTPKGYKEAYDQFVQGGWQGLSYPEQYGGQGLPLSLNIIKSEMMGTANWSFTMYPGLSMGCMNTILEFGTEQQKNTYMPHLVAGTWSGTMCLTEPQCGTDLGQVKTKAEPQSNGHYKISGTKIFISAGEHDLTENIVHIVLARLPDAPKGTKGISLFIVPKFLPTEDGQIGERNAVNCGSIEHKMGIKASATAVLNFEEATGFLIGEPNKGLHAMFTFMNTARLGTAVQGVAHAELSFQGALPYARERLSMRALSGKKDPDKVADAIIHHADVRRMLLTQKAIAEGGRAMIYYTAQIADKMSDALAQGDQAKYQELDATLGFYTPILKGFLTEMGFESANQGVQVFGGHGYIKEWGMEQIVRDARIATLYEGTTGVQALDLLGRKVLIGTRGKIIATYTSEILKFCGQHARNKYLRRFVWDLTKICTQWGLLTTRIWLTARKDRDIVSSASVDYLMFSGYAMMAYFWAQQAAVASDKIEKGDGKESIDFYKAKLKVANFYFDRLLPRSQGHAEAMMNPSRGLTSLKSEHFSFDY